MKITIVFIIDIFEKTLLDNLIEFWNKYYHNINIIIGLSNSIKNECLGNDILNNKSIKKFYFDNRDINLIRNKCIKLCSDDFILFLYNYMCVDMEYLEEIYQICKTNDLDIVTFDFKKILKMSKADFTNETFNSVVSHSRRRYLTDDNILLGTEFYKLMRKKKIEFDYLSIHIYKADFLNENNILFDNENSIYVSDFILKAYLHSTKCIYTPVDLIYDYNAGVINLNQIKTKTLFFEEMNSMFEIIKDIKDKEIAVYLIKDILLKLISIIDCNMNNSYEYLEYLKCYIEDIRNFSTKNEILDIELECDIIDQVPAMYSRITKNSKYYNTQYNDINSITDILNRVENEDNVCEDDLLEMIKILTCNDHLLKYKSYDNIIKYINLYMEGNLKSLNDIISNIKELIVDITMTINDKLIYYKYFEDKFMQILFEVNEVK